MSRKARKRKEAKLKRKSGRQQRSHGSGSGSGRLAQAMQGIEAAITEKLETLEYDAVEVKLQANRALRVIIDREAVGVRIVDCQLVSRAIVEILHELGHDPAGFQLEVSSPGADRPLTRSRDFARFCGSQVTLSLKASDDSGRRNFTGTLLGATNDAVTLQVLDTEGPTTFQRDRIRAVRLRPDPSRERLRSVRSKKRRGS